MFANFLVDAHLLVDETALEIVNGDPNDYKWILNMAWDLHFAGVDAPRAVDEGRSTSASESESESESERDEEMSSSSSKGDRSMMEA